MSEMLVFYKEENWPEVAEEFAQKIASCLRKDYAEEVPIANDGIRTRYRIDPKYVGYDGIAWPIENRDKIIQLIADKLKEVINNPNVRIVYDDTLPRVFTHFLVYL